MPDASTAILVASDDPATIQSVRKALEPIGARLLEGRAAEEVMRLAGADEVRLVLIDMSAKGFGGQALARALKSDIRTLATPLLAIVDPAARRGGGRAIVLDHVDRPLDGDLLRRKVSLILRAQGAPEEPSEGAAAAGVDMGKVQSRIRRTQELRACPYVVTKILKVSQEASTGARDLAEVIGTDQALTAKLLKIANSAMFGGKGRIAQISQAVTRIGFRGVLELAMGIGVMEAFRKNTGAGGLDKPGFWRHSLAVALVARRLALRAGPAGNEEAFVAGLLHDIGKPLLEECFPAEYRHAVELATGLRMPLRSAERELFGADHCFFGGLLLKSWGLPAALEEAVTYHHNAARLVHMEDRQKRYLARLVHMADAFCKAARLGNGGDVLLEETPPDILRELSPVTPQIDDVLAQAEEEMVLHHQFLSMPAEEKEPPAEIPRPLAGRTVEILVAGPRALNVVAFCVRRAGGRTRISDAGRSFLERIRRDPPDAAVLDGGHAETNMRLLDELPEPLAARTVCFVDAGGMRAAQRRASHKAAVFARPCALEDVLMRLGGAGGDEA